MILVPTMLKYGNYIRIPRSIEVDKQNKEKTRMKSFKTIALAMVAAMTMGTLVATSASAAPMVITSVKKNTGTVASPTWTAQTAGTAAATPITIPVPTDNSVDSLDVVEFVVTVDTGTTVSVAATNAAVVPAFATTTAPVTASSGSANWSLNVGTGVTATFYVYTKTTAVSSVAITNQGTTVTYFLQGTSTLIDKIAVTGVDSAPAGTSVTVTATAQDVFGNKISGKTISAIANGATLDTATITTGATLTNFGSGDVKFVAPATGPVTIVFYAAAADMATAVTGFSAPSASSVKIIAVRDLAGDVAALTAQLAAANTAKAAAEAALAAEKNANTIATTSIAALKAEVEALKAKAVIDAAKAKADADLARATYVAEFNALARKWNAKFPKLKVTLKK